MSDWIYVDNSNVFIEGQRVSAVQNMMESNIQEAMNNGTTDPSYRLSYGKLHQFIAGEDTAQIARAILFGSRPPASDVIWKLAEKAGFEVVIHDRNAANKEKKIDTGVVSEMMRDAYKNASSNDVFTLVSGDADFVPAVENLVADGFQVDVVFWSHASAELRNVCSNFISLDDHLDALRP